jgi:polysaccharide pyruvyl transferase WcaK-like protein
MKPKKISFLGLFGQQNLGNECTLQAILFNARKHIPDAKIHCICTDPGDTSSRHGIPAFPIANRFANGLHSRKAWESYGFLRRSLRKVFVQIPMELLHWVKAYKTLSGTDMLAMPGTGFLSDYATRSFSWPYFIFKWSVIAKMCGCKLLFVSVGAGPITHPLSRWFIKQALSMADYRSYRDLYSKEYLESIGFETGDDPVYPDLAFSLPLPEMPAHSDPNGRKPVIGVGLKDYYGRLGLRQGDGEAVYRDYIGKLLTFVSWLLEHRYDVRVLIGDVLYDKRVKQDLMALLEGRKSTGEDGRILDEPIVSVEQLMSQLGATDIVVSPRYHNVILALMLNKPAFSLSYHEKFASLMSGVGLADYCQDIDHLDIDTLIRRVMELEKDAGKIKPSLERTMEEYRKALQEQYSFLFGEFLPDA